MSYLVWPPYHKDHHQRKPLRLCLQQSQQVQPEQLGVCAAHCRAIFLPAHLSLCQPQSPAAAQAAETTTTGCLVSTARLSASSRFIMGDHSVVSRPNDSSPVLQQERDLAAARIRKVKHFTTFLAFMPPTPAHCNM